MINVGIGRTNITPPIGTPSAGYRARKGEGMQGIHDPLFASALFIDNGEKKIAFCSVDHLGFTYEMVQKIKDLVGIEEIYIGSTHTHSGGGSFLNIPGIGESLAGVYNPEIVAFYIEKTVEAILQATGNTIAAKIGIGYGHAENLNKYRALWPLGMTPLSDISVIKITTIDDKPLAALWNYPMHPTILDSSNRLFSADFAGYTRDYLQTQDIFSLYFNGAQGDIDPLTEEHTFEACERVGISLARSVMDIWHEIKTHNVLEITTHKEKYSFKPDTNFGLPIEYYDTEMNLIVFDQKHAFLTIPGELSCIYDHRLKKIAKDLCYEHLSILGLTNDAHGYIISPESWRHKTREAGLSFGGENYGEITEKRAIKLIA